MLSDPNCIFCKIVAGKLPSAQVFENEATLGFMNLQQTQPGHVLIIPKEHYPNIFEMPDEVLGEVTKVAARVARAAKAAFAADGVQMLQNNGTEAWQSVPHYHQHVIPRYKGDVGQNLYAIWTEGKAASAEELEANAAKIRKAL